MFLSTPQSLFLVEMIIFISVILMHAVKKNSSAVGFYLVQSLAVMAMLVSAALGEGSWFMLAAALVSFVIKVVIAPYFFLGLIKRHQLKFAVSTYLNLPLTLLVLTAIAALTYSHFFRALAILAPDNEDALLLALSVVLSSIFLIINRRGVLSQMLGVLSLENGIVSFASLSGLEQSPALQLGIMFDVFVWIVVSTVFASMIYHKFGSLDVSALSRLKEE